MAYKKSLQLAPDNIVSHIGLTATYSMLGREKEARAEAAEILRVNRNLSVNFVAKMLPYKNQSQTEKVSLMPYGKRG